MYNYKSAVKSHTGAVSKQSGAGFEKYIITACKQYEYEGIAKIEKTPEPFHIIKPDKNGMFTGYFEGAAQPDFKGSLKGGRTIVFDAKHTSGDRITLTRLSDPQRESLLAYERMGAVTGVLLSFDFHFFAFIPIQRFLDAKACNNHKYWTAEEAAQYAVFLDNRGYLRFLDWRNKDNV